MNHNTGWYCWIYGERTWHRTHEGAYKRACRNSNWASNITIDCARCGCEDIRCECDGIDNPHRQGD